MAAFWAELANSWDGQAIVRLLMAAALGALIGLEREHHGRAAGLRTQLLVALGAATAMLVSLYFGQVYGSGEMGKNIQVDPARVAYGVMGGVGFLGAGAIIHYGAGIRGLTTAASLWCSASIGLAAGFGMFVVAVAATAIVLFALVVLDLVERHLPEKVTKAITVTVPGTSAQIIQQCRKALSAAGAGVINVDVTRDFKADQSTITFAVSVMRSKWLHVPQRLQEGLPQITHLRAE